MIFNADNLPIPSELKLSLTDLMKLGINNTESIGLFLYTDYFIIFQISGFLLLLAMIGAIVLAQSDNQNPRKVSVFKQKNVDKNDIIKLN